MNRDILELREVITKLVPLLTGKGLKVTQRGSEAYVSTDPKTKRPISVNIPSISDNATPEFIRAIQGYIDHEVAHVLLTDWNHYAGGESDPRKIASREYQQFQNTHNIVEDTMIEREIVNIFPGSRKNIADLRRMFIDNISLPAIKKCGADEKKAFIYILVPLMRALSGHEEFIEMMDDNKLWDNQYVQGVVKGLKPATMKALKTCSTTKETLAIARELHEILYPPAPPAPTPAPPPPPVAPPSPPEKKEKGKSEDKPEKKAGEGEGTGERDHEDSEGDADESGDEADTGGAAGSEPEDEEAGEPADGDDAGKAPREEPGDEDGSDDGDDTDDAGKPTSKPDRKDDAADPTGADDEADDAGEPDGAGSAAGGAVDLDDDVDDASGAAGGSAGADAAGDPEPGDEGDDDTNGAGVGSSEDGASKSIFDFDEDAFDKTDMASAIAIMISEDAVEAMNRSDYNVYTREFDRIETAPVPNEMDARWVPKMEDRVKQMTGRMQKDIERLLASQSHVIRIPGKRKGKLHAPSLYRVTQGDERVFSQKEEHTSKDTAVMLLIDNSGSMHGDKMETAMLSGYAMSSCLERVSIPHEVIGFTTGDFGAAPRSMLEAMEEEVYNKGIHYHRIIPLMMPIYKDFDERVSPQVKARIAYAANAQRGLSGNIDGECLEYAAQRLMKRKEKRKVMIVFSDGQPAGDCAGPHLKSVVRDLEDPKKFGIDCIGIGIQDSSVKHYYPKHVVLSKVEDLPGQAMQELKKILL